MVNNQRPTILLSNDDGIHAPGLKALWEALHAVDIADLVIIAPASEKSGTGASITWDRPISLEQIIWPKQANAWSVDGTPADCIKMGLSVILDSPPDYIISGINAGSNAGGNVLHSGTIGAVIEGVLRHIPGIALSCEDVKTPNYHVAQKYVDALIRYVMEHPLPIGSFLNVNFPHAAQDKVAGFRLTRQGKGRWGENPMLHLETKKGPSYWMGGKPEELVEDQECDISYLKQGFMTAVPIHVQELTDHAVLSKRQEAFEKYFLDMDI